MTFISYAQNAEDVILYRALRHVAEGFYVDVGAQDPVNDSVTRAFYDRGWHGINVEPVPRWFGRLQEDRPRDINVQAIVADRRGVETIREVDGTGLSTVDQGIAEQHLREGHFIREFEVRQLTLDDICEQHDVTTIHFLKVDVEGHEAKVIGGMAFDKYRPWIALVEATAPNSQVETHAAWEPKLVANGYTFVYADGLNRFYVANEKLEELRDAFRYPPNFFDDYERMPVHWLRQHADRLQGDLDALELEREKLLTRASVGQGDEHDMLVALRARYRRVRAEVRLLHVQSRKRQQEFDRLNAEQGGLLEAGRAARRYRMQLFATEEQLAERLEQLEAKDREIGGTQAALLAIEGHADGLARQRDEALEQAAEWKRQLDVILRSSSWRVTRPVRVVRRLFSNPGVHGGRREILRRLSGIILRVTARLPGARRFGGALLRRMPALRDRLLRLHGVGVDGSVVGESGQGMPISLSPVADMYAQALRGAGMRARDSTEGGR